ncbi:MAG: hypothetical protein E7148_00555 [Rikenellaceae bacterium]|nr:hypothetical protein [Rikenellaceae bacterium]
MKSRYSVLIALLVVALLNTSCSNVRKIWVSGKSGTSIYTPDKKHVATIDNKGIVKIKVDIDCPYHLAKSQGSDLYVPFAIDIKDRTDWIDLPGGGQVAMIMAYCWTWPLIPFYEGVLFKKDKPLDAQTNNDLFD